MTNELDLKVAVKVMGWTDTGNGLYDESGIWHPEPPPYSTNRESAMAVVDEIALHWCYVEIKKEANAPWKVVLDYGAHFVATGIHHDLAMAICETALRLADLGAEPMSHKPAPLAEATSPCKPAQLQDSTEPK